MSDKLFIDDVEYTFRLGDFIKTKKKATDLLHLLKGAISTVTRDNQSSFDIDIGALVSNIGSPEMQGIENFILQYLTVSVDGKELLMKNPDAVTEHFNKYRSHYFQVIFEGAKYHFLPFIPGGLELFKSMSLSGAMASLM